MQVLSLLVRHNCPFSRPVGSTQGRVTHLCHRGKEAMLEIHDPTREGFLRLVAEYRRIGGEVLYEERDHSAALVRFPACACCTSGQVIPTIERQGYLYLPPSTCSADGENYQFLAP